jgi:hypothetical protein
VIITAPASKILENGQPNPWAYRICKNQVNPVRALVFSQQKPSRVVAQVGDLEPVAMELVSESLWSAQVDTTELTAGVHPVQVTAWTGDKMSDHVVRVDFYSDSCPNSDGEGSGEAGAQDGGLLQETEMALDAVKEPDQDETANTQEGSSFDDGVNQTPSNHVDSGCSCEASFSFPDWKSFGALLVCLLALIRIRKPW